MDRERQARHAEVVLDHNPEYRSVVKEWIEFE